MEHKSSPKIKSTNRRVDFYGGIYGALLPFVVFIIGVVSIALSGAPDEKGFWPVIIFSLAIGLVLSKNKKEFSEAVIDGMSERIVMIMIVAWILASIIGVLMTSTGFVEALLWLSEQIDLGPIGYTVCCFIMCCIVSLSTGSSFATILICAPLLYPSGGLLGCHLPTLAGAIIAGATFGDFSAPISDTTIASALSQNADIGKTVKSRIKYIFPATVLALIGFVISSDQNQGALIESKLNEASDPKGLVMILIPVVIIWLFIRGTHLIHGLIYGLLFGIIVALLSGLMPVNMLLSLDLENFTAKSFIIDGINRVVGISFFTILLMGLVGAIKSSGVIDHFINFFEKNSSSRIQTESRIVGIIWAAVMLTTHSIVAILVVSDYINKTNESGIGSVRRANIMSLIVCIFPFLLPYFIPVILMSNMTKTGQEFGIDSVGALEVGFHNFIAWALLIIVFISIVLGFGREHDNSLSNKTELYGE